MDNATKLDLIIKILLFERRMEKLGCLVLEGEGDERTLVARKGLWEDRKKLAILYYELEKMEAE